MHVIRIDDEIITAEDFVKLLKLDNVFTDLIEDIVINKLTVHAAKKSGLTVGPEEIQARADQFRRVEGLHRAQDTHRYLEGLGVTLADFENYIAESLYCEKMRNRIATPQTIEDYFRLHSPKFEALEVSHIVTESEAKAKELMSLLEDEPDCFAEYARAYSLDNETRVQGGYIGKVFRGSIAPSIEIKLFNAEIGEPLGPFTTQDELVYEIYQVSARHPAKLDDAIKSKIAKIIYNEWLQNCAREHILEVM